MSFAKGDPDCRNPGAKPSDIWNPPMLKVGSADEDMTAPPHYFYCVKYPALMPRL
jgi:hypothetical protein